MTGLYRFLAMGPLTAVLLTGPLLIGCGNPESISISESPATDEQPAQEGVAAAPAGEFDFAAMQGEWSIVGADGGVGETVTISEAASYAWSIPGRPDASLVFQPDAESPQGVVKLTYESTEDTEEVGGGGPRKAIARRADNGDVEILVGRSAADDYPGVDSDLTPECVLRRP